MLVVVLAALILLVGTAGATAYAYSTFGRGAGPKETVDQYLTAVRAGNLRQASTYVCTAHTDDVGTEFSQRARQQLGKGGTWRILSENLRGNDAVVDVDVTIPSMPRVHGRYTLVNEDGWRLCGYANR